MSSFNQNFRPLSNDQLFRAAPSIFATQARDDRSEKYRFVPTIEVLDALRSEGFHPVQATESRTLDQSNRPFVKHHIRLRRESDLGIRLTSFDTVLPEIALTNSHNGTSSFILDAALHRLVCSNGLVVADSQGALRYQHSGSSDLAGRVLEGAYSIVADFPKIADRVQEFRGIQPGEALRLALAKSALPLRFDPDEVTGEYPVKPEQLLQGKRYQDRTSTDLFTTFNVVQENLIRGGINLGRKNGRRVTTRKVSSVDRDLRLNRSLWTLTEELAKIAKAA